jgi:uncharacterized membrane protein YfcA
MAGGCGEYRAAAFAVWTTALLSLVVVRMLGQRVGSREQHMSRTVFIRRLLGTAVLMSAVALVLSRSG